MRRLNYCGLPQLKLKADFNRAVGDERE